MDFDLVNWDGKSVSLSTLNEKVVVLTFSYSYCSARCPIITGRLNTLDQSLGSPPDVVYLHVSVDPEMDSENMRESYFSLYGIDPEKDNRWLFVSGEKRKLENMWKHYKVKIRKIPDTNIPEGYYIEYSPIVLLIDKQGNISEDIGFFFSEDEATRKIHRLRKGSFGQKRVS